MPLDSINRESANHHQVTQLTDLALPDRSVAVTEQDTADRTNTGAGPVEHKGMFVADKTYILFDMTGDVGISMDGG